MPQLDSSSFISQILWVILGFLCIFIIAKNILVPSMENSLESRENLKAHYKNEITELKFRIEQKENANNILLKSLIESNKRQITKMIEEHEQEKRKILSEYEKKYIKEHKNISSLKYDTDEIEKIAKEAMRKF